MADDSGGHFGEVGECVPNLCCIGDAWDCNGCVQELHAFGQNACGGTGKSADKVNPCLC